MAVSVAAHGESGLAVTVASAFAVVASRSGAGGPMNGDAGAKSRLLGWLARMTGARPVATAVTAGTPAAGGFRTDRTFGPGPGSAGPVPVPGSPPPESTSHRVDLARGSITENARNRNVCGIRFSADPPTVPKKCYRQASSNVAPID
ncbi:MAG TPA: hypothetical protein VFT95_15585 [Micromonosporaceae bacterium]|nr:hypothetical protein [Micromonosporaceae bacterium]